MFSYRIIIMLFSIFFANQSFANELQGKLRKELTKNELNQNQMETLKNFFDSGRLISINSEKKQIILKQGKFSQVSWNACENIDTSLNIIFIECLIQTDGFYFPSEYLQACDKVTGTNSISNKAACMDYLSNVNSHFDLDLFKLCISENKGSFSNTKNCINIIRDRIIDVQNVQRKCIDERSIFIKFEDCLSTLADKAPASTPNCSEKQNLRTLRGGQ